MTRPAPLATVAAVLLAAATFAACGADADAGPFARPASAECEARGRYTVVAVLDDVYGAERVLVNGFPLVFTTGPGSMMAPGSRHRRDPAAALVSGRNTVTVAVAPAIHGGAGPPAAGPARFHSWVCGPDGSVVPGTRRGVAASDSAFAAWRAELERRWAGWSASGGAAADSAEAWAARNPVAVTASFVRPGGAGGRPSDGAPSFDAVLRDAPVIAGTAADSARLRAFAVRLRDLTAARDTAAVFDAFRPSLADAFAAGGGAEGVGEDSASFMANVRTRVVMDGVVPFGAGDVGLRSWAGGRVWELYRGEAEGLLEPPDRSTFRKVFVGEGPDGALHVVR